jgi:outer membrane protein assembly factor BamB
MSTLPGPKEDFGMHRLRLLLLLGFCCLSLAADWPQWLGPRRDGTSEEAVAPWKEAPRVLWQKPLGEGHSSPVVADGRVFVHARVGSQRKEEVICFDAASGEEKWRIGYERAGFQSIFGNGPRATPTVIDGKVYAFGVTGVLACLEASSGKLVWKVDTLKQFKAANLFFGMSCSPLVEGDAVLVNVGGKKASIVALDRKDGTTRWQALDDSASYSSPIALGKGKTRQAVFLTGANVVSLSPDDGSVFWKFPLRDKLFESSTTPVRAGELLLASSITYGSVGLRLESKDGRPTVKEEWKKEELTPYFSTPVPDGKGRVFMVTGKNPLSFRRQVPEATLHCIEAGTGKMLWKKEKVGKYHASLLRTGNGKLLLLSDTGALALLEPDPGAYRELARAQVSGPETWAHPALSEGRLYVRDAGKLLCLQLKP